MTPAAPGRPGWWQASHDCCHQPMHNIYKCEHVNTPRCTTFDRRVSLDQLYSVENKKTQRLMSCIYEPHLLGPI